MKSLQISELPAKNAPNVGTPANRIGHDTAAEKSSPTEEGVGDLFFE